MPSEGKFELLKVTAVYRPGKRVHYKVSFSGGEYLEDSVRKASDRVQEVLEFLAKSLDMDLAQDRFEESHAKGRKKR